MAYEEEAWPGAPAPAVGAPWRSPRDVAASASPSQTFSPQGNDVLAAIPEGVLEGAQSSGSSSACTNGAVPGGSWGVSGRGTALPSSSATIPDELAAFLASLGEPSRSRSPGAVPGLGLGFEPLPSLDAVVAAQANLAAVENDNDNKFTLRARTAVLNLLAAVVHQAADFRAFALDARGCCKVLREMWTASQREAVVLRDKLVGVRGAPGWGRRGPAASHLR